MNLESLQNFEIRRDFVDTDRIRTMAFAKASSVILMLHMQIRYGRDGQCNFP